VSTYDEREIASMIVNQVMLPKNVARCMRINVFIVDEFTNVLEIFSVVFSFSPRHCWSDRSCSHHPRASSLRLRLPLDYSTQLLRYFRRKMKRTRKVHERKFPSSSLHGSWKRRSPPVKVCPRLRSKQIRGSGRSTNILPSLARASRLVEKERNGK